MNIEKFKNDKTVEGEKVMISYKILKEENELYKKIIERQTRTMRKAQDIWGESIKRKEKLINELISEEVDQNIIERVKAI